MGTSGTVIAVNLFHFLGKSWNYFLEDCQITSTASIRNYKKVMLNRKKLELAELSSRPNDKCKIVHGVGGVHVNKRVLPFHLTRKWPSWRQIISI